MAERTQASLGCLVRSAFFAAATLFSGIAPAAAEEVDLELVLAMDGSGSINPTEFKLQIEGTAAALTEPALRQAILSGPLGRIAIAGLIWSDAAFPKYPTEWHLLDSEASIDAFASRILTFTNPATNAVRQGKGGGGTGIGEGIVYALEMIRTNRFQGLRKVVDVSGDGVETDPWFEKALMLPDARVLAAAQQVTVNGLAILTDNARLDEYYRENVIQGPGAFVIRADNFVDFHRAIRLKLLREVSQKITLKEPNGPAPQVCRKVAQLVPRLPGAQPATR